jgi:GTP-binding protein
LPSPDGPNVGKSTLFNRIVGPPARIWSTITPGRDRDRREAEAQIDEVTIRLIDTAGLEEARRPDLEGRMRLQTEAAIGDADLVLFVIDARSGVTPVDRHFAQVLRASGKPVALLANKAESRAAEPGIMEGYSLGFGDPIAYPPSTGSAYPMCLETIRDAMPGTDT